MSICDYCKMGANQGKDPNKFKLTLTTPIKKAFKNGKSTTISVSTPYFFCSIDCMAKWLVENTGYGKYVKKPLNKGK